MKYIYLEWYDAVSEDSWTNSQQINEDLPIIVTCGIYIKKTSKAYIVALNYDTANDNYSCIMTIPKAWVKNMRFIKID